VVAVRANRAFLDRAVRYLAGEAGIRQFLDIGTGIPTADNTHEVAQSVAGIPDRLYGQRSDGPRALQGLAAAIRKAPPLTSKQTCIT
jgi:hypothetical protein